MHPRLLVIDDEKELGELLDAKFSPHGFRVITRYSGLEGLKAAYQFKPDLIILDIMMPGMDGYDVCRSLREVTNAPIVMLTAKATEDDVVKGFELGATDYVKKPFSLKELEIRVKSLLKQGSRSYKEENMYYDDGVLKIDLERRLVFYQEQLVYLTPTEYRLLKYLFQHRDQVPSHQDILSNVWGEGYRDATSCLSIYIRYLREKIEPDPQNPTYIRTLRGRGYSFSPSHDSKKF